MVNSIIPGAGVHVKVLGNIVLAVVAVVGALKAPRVQAGHGNEALVWRKYQVIIQIG